MSRAKAFVKRHRFVFFFVALALMVCGGANQLAGQTTPDSIERPQPGSSLPIEHGAINMANGNVHLEIPLTSSPQRGDIAVGATLVYDSKIWDIVDPCGWGCPFWDPGRYNWREGGWYLKISGANGKIGYMEGSVHCTMPNDSSPFHGFDVLVGVTYLDEGLVTHLFPVPQSLNQNPTDGCIPDGNHTYTGEVATGRSYATDGSGYFAEVTASPSNVWAYPFVKIFNPQGVQVFDNAVDGGASPHLIDRNGNYVLSQFGSVISDTKQYVPLQDTVAARDIWGQPAKRYYDVSVGIDQTARYTVNYRQIQLNTAFNTFLANNTPKGTLNFDVLEYDEGMYVIDSIQLPDGSSYRFSYDEGHYGEMTGMVLPHGGNVSFSYGMSPGIYKGKPTRWVSSYSGSSGSTTFQWNYNSSSSYSELGTGCGQITNTANGSTQKSTFTFSICNNTILPRKVVHGTTAGVWASTQFFDYDTNTKCPHLGDDDRYILCTGAIWRNLISTSTIVPSDASGGKKATTTTYAYDIPESGIPTLVKQWDYYTVTTDQSIPTPPGNPARQTSQTLGYSANHALLPTYVSHMDGAGVPLSSVTYGYDDSNYVKNTGATIPNLDTTYQAGNRGNLTSVARCCDENGQTQTYHYRYDQAGVVIGVIDPKLRETVLGHDDETDTFVTSVAAPDTASPIGPAVKHSISKSYDIASGQLISVTDQNGQTVTNAYDTIGRPYTTTFSNGGSPVILSTATYPSINETDVASLQSSTSVVKSSTTVDSYGRTVTSKTGDVTVDTVYDGNGRLYSVSNPHTTYPTGTDGIKTVGYDDLGRTQTVTAPDGHQKTYSYVGSSVTVADALQHSRQYDYNAFQQITKAWEPDANGSLTLASEYTYDALGRLKQIAQKGGSTNSDDWRTRTFNYDGLGRLISQTTPEQGTQHFYYDANGNLWKTQNANTSNNTSTFTYDEDNRLVQAAIQGKGTYTYTYDAQDSSQDPFGKGRVTSTSNGSNVKTSYTHDVAGRLASTTYCMPTNCSPGYTASATYDFQNNVTSLTYPDGRRLNWTYNDLNQQLSGTYNQSGTTGTYFSNAQYAPSGALQQMTYGNGVQFGASYDSNLNIKSLAYLSNGKALTNRAYTWDLNAANLRQVSDSSWGRTETYSYDQFDRLQSYSDTGTTASACLANVAPISPASQTFTLDAWGNLKQSGNWSFLQDTNQNNQLQSGSSSPYYLYDNAGNLTSDGTGTTYSYSSDGALVGASTSSGPWLYIYDALGHRIGKNQNTTEVDHFYFGGALLGFTTAGVWFDKLYGPNGFVAMFNSGVGPDPIYRTVDHLGSIINQVKNSGDIKTTETLFPFGQVGIKAGGGDIFAFTDHETFAESGTYSTLFRNYSPTQGRWTTPDPYNGSYDLTDPQSFNRYAYLNNRPMNATDPTGLCGDGDDSDCGDWGDDGGNGWSVWASGDWGAASYQLNFYYDGGGSYGNTASVSADSGSDWSFGLDALQLVLAGATIFPGPQSIVLNGINAGISFARGRPAEGFAYTAAATLSAFTPGSGLIAQEFQGISLAVREAEQVGIAASTETVASELGELKRGDKLFRVFGENNKPVGSSWSRVDPRTVANYRDAAGLPSVNTGRFVIEGEVLDITGATVRPALPLDGNLGGLDEIYFENGVTNQVRLTRVSGVNPPY